MKKTLSTAIFSLLGLALFAGNGLIVVQKMGGSEANNMGVTMTWYVTNTQCKLKMDLHDDKVNTSNWFIPDLGQGALLSFPESTDGGDKVFYSIPVQSISTKEAAPNRIALNKTGETKTISGYVCEKVIVKTNKTITEMWLTKEFKPELYKFANFFQSSYEFKGLGEESLEGFPMESTTRDLGGKVISSLSFVSATSADLKAEDFMVPADYKSAQ